MLIRASISILFFIIFFVNSGFFISVKSYGLSNKPTKYVFDKLPNKMNLIDYLRSLHRIIDFCIVYKSEIDINFDFGLFLAYINLKYAYKEKNASLPERIKYNLKELLHKTERLLEYFSYMVRQDHHPRNVKYKAIFGLFRNASKWINHLPKFNYFTENASDSLKEFYMNWDSYTAMVNNINHWVPAPHQSDLCLQSLASSTENLTNVFNRCNILTSCYEMLKNGTDFGYALTHRLLFLLQARMGRGCVIFTRKEDKQISQKFCSIAYREIQYIALHEFKLVDLLLEQMCLCALDGSAEFLRRSWLANVLEFQTAHGCFSTSKQKGIKRFTLSQTNVWKLAKTRDHNILAGQCNGHTTALAAATYAMAVRFITERHY